MTFELERRRDGGRERSQESVEMEEQRVRK